MKGTLLVPIVLAIVVSSHGQDVTNREPESFAASVRELKGKCLVRDNGAEKPRALKSGDKLRAGQQVRCEPKADVKIRFRNSNAEKEIKAAPEWYVIPNVPAASVNAPNLKLAGRSKGDPALVATAEGVPQSAQLISDSVTVTRDETVATRTFDEADQYWKLRNKYFLIIAPSEAALADRSQPFAKVDAREISKALTRFGYSSIQILNEKDATQGNVITELEKIQKLDADTSVLIYYSGHAVTTEEKDLWLQLDGQNKIGPYRGLSLTSLVAAARGSTYKGHLALILDTCHSGTRPPALFSLPEMENTLIFASSADKESSYTKRLVSGVEISAFTYYFIQGLNDDWDRVDGDRDGIVLYTELLAYISNQLMEELSDHVIAGSMRPQLLGSSQLSWLAYDPTRAHNLKTEARRTLHLARHLQIRDPEKVMGNLPDPLPTNADSYLKALRALSEHKIDDADRLLNEAEKERMVPTAEIYWARAYLKMEQRQIGAVREWLRKALEASQHPNPDLIAYNAMMDFGFGDWKSAEQLLKQVLETSRGERKPTEKTVMSLFTLTMLNVFQGDVPEATALLERLKRIDLKAVEFEDEDDAEDLNALVPFLEVISDVLQNKKDEAREKLADARTRTASVSGPWGQGFTSILQTIENALASDQGDAVETQGLVVSAEELRSWDEALTKSDVMALTFLLTRLRMVASLPDSSSSLTSREVQKLLKSTVEFANAHKAQRQKVTINYPDGLREVDVEGTENRSAIESANILANVAAIYAALDDYRQAEDLYKEAIALDTQLDWGAMLAMQPTLELAQLYKESKRFPEAERYLKRLLIQVNQSLGERNLFSVLIQGLLGEVYEETEKFEDAERSFRSALRLALITCGPESFMTDTMRGDLARYLSRIQRTEEAAQLFEESIFLLERNKSTSALTRESLADNYFDLAKSYYALKRYRDAETLLQKTFEFYSSRTSVAPADILDVLHWQWATAYTLNKPSASEQLYTKMIDICTSEIAKPRPSKSLGSELQYVAIWFRDSQQNDKAQQLLELSLKLQEKAYGGDRAEVAQVWENIGYLHITRNEFGSAHATLKKAEALYGKGKALNDQKYSNLLYWMGYSSYESAELQQARDELQKSVDLSKSADARNARYTLGKVQRSAGQYAIAKATLELVLNGDERGSNTDPLAVASDLMELTAISRLTGNRPEADRWLSRAETVMKAIDPLRSPARWARLNHERGMAALLAGRTKEAERLFTEAIAKGRLDPEMDRQMFVGFLDDYAKVLRLRGKNKEAIVAEQQAKQIRDQLKR
jgi:tetratricopeptide (TPR) repeat protein